MEVPTLSVTFLIAALVPLVLGFLVGMVVKTTLKIGAIIAIIILILIGLGMLEPSQVINPIVSLFKSGPSIASKANQVAGFLPYSSITFLIGLAIGFLKG